MASLLHNLINIKQFTVHTNQFANQIQSNLRNDQFRSLEIPQQLQKSSESEARTFGQIQNYPHL